MGKGKNGTPNWQNRTLFHGDNLEFLRRMNSNSVRLIATDPPFNKGKDFHATPDSLAAGASFQDRWSWKKDAHQDWIDQITDDFPKLMEAIQSARSVHSDGMGAYLCFMAVRLLEMRRVLREDGSIYIHCDATASHYLKAIMDAIFGHENFRNEIVWCYTGPSNTKQWFPRKHDTILFYSKSDKWLFNLSDIRVPYSDLYVKRFSKRYKEGSDKSTIFKSGHDTERNQELAQKGKLPEDWWSEFSPVGRSKTENVGYPTQKPLALYERIIKASSNAGDVVLDPFAGCATTCIAAERLGRQWVGIDIWRDSREQVLDRLQVEGMMALKNRNLKVNKGESVQPYLEERDISFTNRLPDRTDGGDIEAPFLKTITKKVVDKEPRMRRKDLLNKLVAELGMVCQGCDRKFEHIAYLEIDHKLPRSDGGSNDYYNRTLLCSPCNRNKSNKLTLTGLRQQNKREGFMGG